MNRESNTTPAQAGTGTSASLSTPDSPLQRAAAESEAKRLVWDLPLRAFHWLFAASILASWATATAGFSWMQWHIRLGYWMIGLLSFRVLWGFVGPRHARFTSFLSGPRAMLRYAKGLTGSGEPVHTVGHNPLGGVMVIIMLLLVAFQVSTGLFATDDIAWNGPYYPTVSSATAHLLTSLHHKNFDLIWAAIALHVGAIAYYAFLKKQNLVPAMLTGWKPAEAVPADEAIPSSQLWKALVVMIVCVGIVYAVLSGAPHVAPGALDFN